MIPVGVEDLFVRGEGGGDGQVDSVLRRIRIRGDYFGREMRES
jgi:hypothetical protein